MDRGIYRIWNALTAVFALKYACSILQDDLSRCYRCGRRDQHLDRHEIFGGSNRRKSAAMGLWVVLCHDRCHLNGVHRDGELMRKMRAEGQRICMSWYGMTKEEFIKEFGKSYLED